MKGEAIKQDLCYVYVDEFMVPIPIKKKLFDEPIIRDKIP